MNIKHGNGKTVYGPGVAIELSGEEVARAIDAWLVGQDVHIQGARTVRVNGEIISKGYIYVDPSGSVITDGERISGRG